MVPVSRSTSTRCAFDNARSNTVRNASVSTTCPTIVARNGSATWRLVPARRESWRTITLASSACTSSSSSNRFAVSVNLDVWRKLRSSHHPVLAVTSPIPPMTSKIVAPISRSLRRSLTLCSFVRYSPVTPVHAHTAPSHRPSGYHGALGNGQTRSRTLPLMPDADDELLDDDQRLIAEAVRGVCSGFDDDYWARCDREHEFPWDFYARMAEGGWVGIAMPEEYGGGGRGITDAAVVLHEVAASGAAMNGCSALHLTIFGLNPVAKFGNDRLKAEFLPRAAAGDLHVAFGVTEPDAGTDTGRITTRAEPDGKGGWLRHRPQDLDVEGTRVRGGPAPRPHRRQGQRLARPQPLPRRPRSRLRRHPRRSRRSGATRSRRARSPTTGLPVEGWRLVGTEDEGFRHLLHGLNPERILLASEACGIGEVALDRAITYAKERIVFDRPIGANQAISHPLAQARIQLRAAWMMALHAGRGTTPASSAAKRRTAPSTSPPKRGSSPPTAPCRPSAAWATRASTTSSATGARPACSASPPSARR